MRPLVAIVAAAALLAACSEEQPGRAPTEPTSNEAETSVEPSPKTLSSPPPIADEPRGDAARGRELVATFQCNRCHGGLDAEEVEPTPVERHCTACHQKVLDGGFDQEEESARWKDNVHRLTEVPTLASIGERYAYGWIVRFLLDPHQLRPHLVYSMPDLDLDAEHARDIATYLVDDAVPRPAIDLSAADASRGRRLLDGKGCTGCHTMSGVEPFENAPSLEGLEGEPLRAAELAPDLRYARDRMTAATLVAWIADPESIQPGTRMPDLGLSDEEARDIAAYVLTAELGEPEPAARATMPEPLQRRVGYDEVAENLFDVTCRHCHGDPDVALGDGGPGNTGGFGYQPRGLELTSYERVQAGYLDDEGERHSVFEKMEDGTPRLVASLLARHDEVAGRPRQGIRGMPLGLPPIPMETIQLLVTWIEQGRPRD